MLEKFVYTTIFFCDIKDTGYVSVIGVNNIFSVFSLLVLIGVKEVMDVIEKKVDRMVNNTPQVE